MGEMLRDKVVKEDRMVERFGKIRVVKNSEDR
jgi:hypothetical protein